MVEHLWAGWRMPYIRSTPEDQPITIPDGMTLFEAILHSGQPDDETYILWRGEHSFALLNAYPYTSGHVMVLPQPASLSTKAVRISGATKPAAAAPAAPSNPSGAPAICGAGLAIRS